MDTNAAETLTWEPADSSRFTGRAWFGPMRSPEQPEDLNVLGVLFEPGARTDWHTHPGGQVLYVVSGAAWVCTADGTRVRLGPGDTAWADPGERHWHGATPDGYCMHLSITTGGATEWEESVDAEAYRG